MLVKLEVVTAVPWRAKVLAVTVPLIAGRDAIVTLLPTVTEEIEIGTVPLIDAVTEPICAVPATKAGSVVRDTGCVPWKKVPLTGTVPLMLAVTLPICAVPAPRVTEPAIVCVPVGLAVTVPAIVTVLPTVTDAIETGWVAGKLEMETTLPLTALRISVIA